MSSAAAAPSQPVAPSSEGRTLSRRRRVGIWTLIVLATVIALVSTLTLWVKRGVLDNHGWNTATKQVIEDPTLKAALSTYLVNQLYQNVDVSAALEQRLPKNLKPLAAPLAGALEQPATNAVNFLFTRPRVEQLFINASSVAHQKVVNVLENKTGHGISTGKGVVTLDVHELIVELGTQLGLPSGVLQKVPKNAGVLTLMRSNQLKAAQTGVRVIKVASVWLLVLVFAMYAAAVYLARGARRATLRNVGWALLILGLVVLVIRRLLGSYLVSALAKPGYEASTHRLWIIGTAVLGQLADALVFYGIFVVLAAVVAGPTRPATAIRRWFAPVLNERPAIAWSVAGALYLLILLWQPTHALGTWWGILLFGALAAAGVAALRRETLVEFPETAAGREKGPSLRERLEAVSGPKEPAVAAEAAAAGGERSPAEEIEKLRALHEQGVITDEEFERGKQRALT